MIDEEAWSCSSILLFENISRYSFIVVENISFAAVCCSCCSPDADADEVASAAAAAEASQYSDPK